MWLIRELLRLIEKVLLAVVIAVLVAEGRALLVGGDTFRALQISLILIGAFMLAMSAMGPGTGYDRRLGYLSTTMERYTGYDPVTGGQGRVLTAGAVFFISGAIVIALGLFI